MSSDNVIGAFSEEQAERLTGVSRAQLRRWDKIDFFKPAYSGAGNRAFNRIYSFRDIVSLRVLNQLRNVHNVSMPELRKAAAKLAHLGEDLWAKTTLWVHRGKVVYQEPTTKKRYEVTTSQWLFSELPLRIAINDTHKAIADMNKRGHDEVGKVVRTKYINNMAWVIAGTRIPVQVIKDYVAAGYGEDRILKDYPDLTAADIKAALAHGEAAAA
jgi:uncharacterized protein (DUF433 family)/DNA-binding transcriptional MerR regulator